MAMAMEGLGGRVEHLIDHHAGGMVAIGTAAVGAMYSVANDVSGQTVGTWSAGGVLVTLVVVLFRTQQLAIKSAREENRQIRDDARRDMVRLQTRVSQLESELDHMRGDGR